MKAFLIALLTLCVTSAFGIDFSNSKWIWTNEIGPASDAPVGSRAFRRDFYSPQGKTAISANILIIADNAYTLYVNGNKIGSGSAYMGSSNADAYCIRLAPDCNVFAVNATNIGPDVPGSPNPAGLLATIQIRYSDGFTDTIVTDGTWHAFTSVPLGFEQITFDDSAWPPATSQGTYGVYPWHSSAVIPAAASSTPLQLTDANWIWTTEVPSPSTTAPIGARAFRKEITLPAGQRATSATIVISADNDYTLYFQGRVVGSGTSYKAAQRYVVDIEPPASDITVAIYGVNDSTGGPAGVIAAVELTMEDCECGSMTSFVTDSSWKFNTTVPNGFELPGFDDTKWKNAFVEGKYGIAPWGNLVVPTTVSPASAALKGAPSANPAVVVA